MIFFNDYFLFMWSGYSEEGCWWGDLGGVVDKETEKNLL